MKTNAVLWDGGSPKAQKREKFDFQVEYRVY